MSDTKTGITIAQPSTQPLTQAVVAQETESSVSSSSSGCNPVIPMFVYNVTTIEINVLNMFFCILCSYKVIY